MITPEQLDLFKQYISQSMKIVIFFSAGATYDQVAGALALAQGLEQEERDATVISPVETGPELQNLAGIQKVTHQLGNQNLQISFPYQPEQVDKVSYHIDEDGQKFHLIVQPKSSSKPLDAQQVEFLYTGAAADLIIYVGVNSLEELEQLYFGFEDFHANTNSLSINTFPTPFGSTKFDITGLAAYTEAIDVLLSTLQVELTPEIATTLLSGIEYATDSFRSFATTATTFETAARLLNAGARRVSRTRTLTPAPTPLPARSAPSGDEIAQAFARMNKTAKPTDLSAEKKRGVARPPITKKEPPHMDERPLKMV